MKKISFVIIFILILCCSSSAFAIDYATDSTYFITNAESNLEDSVISILYRSDITIPSQLFTDLSNNCSYYITLSTVSNKFWIYTYRFNVTTTNEWEGTWNYGDEQVPCTFYTFEWLNFYSIDTSTSTPTITYTSNRLEQTVDVPSPLFNQFSNKMQNVLVYFGYTPPSSSTTDITNSINNLDNTISSNYSEFSNTSVSNTSAAVIDTSIANFTDSNNTDSFLTGFMNFFSNSFDTVEGVYTINIPLPHDLDPIVLTTAPVQEFYSSYPQIANLISLFWYFVIGRYFLAFGLRLLNWMRGEEGENGFSVSILSQILGNYNIITRDILFM